MNKEILDYTREELKGIIYSDSKKLKEMYPSYRWGQAVFNYILHLVLWESYLHAV